MRMTTRISAVTDRRYKLRLTQPLLQKMFRLAAETDTFTTANPSCVRTCGGLAACPPQFVSPRLAGRHLKHVSLQFGTDWRVAPDYRGECLMFEIVHPSGWKVGLIPEPVPIAQPGELIS